METFVTVQVAVSCSSFFCCCFHQHPRSGGLVWALHEGVGEIWDRTDTCTDWLVIFFYCGIHDIWNGDIFKLVLGRLLTPSQSIISAFQHVKRLVISVLHNFIFFFGLKQVFFKPAEIFVVKCVVFQQPDDTKTGGRLCSLSRIYMSTLCNDHLQPSLLQPPTSQKQGLARKGSWTKKGWSDVNTLKDSRLSGTITFWSLVVFGEKKGFFLYFQCFLITERLLTFS